jgi:hypothetical protein
VGIFEFVIVIVIVATAGEVIKARVGRPAPTPPSDQGSSRLTETVEQLHQRVLRLEEERDFYRALLEPGEDAPKGGSDAALPSPPSESPDPRA